MTCDSAYRLQSYARSRLNVVIAPLTYSQTFIRIQSEYCHIVWYGKTRMAGQPESDKKSLYFGIDRR